MDRCMAFLLSIWWDMKCDACVNTVKNKLQTVNGKVWLLEANMKFMELVNKELKLLGKLAIQGSLPDVREGHAVVNIGRNVACDTELPSLMRLIHFCLLFTSKKVYDFEGIHNWIVGDKHYYNDVWVLDVSSCRWDRLDICGQQPQGRFSHTVIFTKSNIVIYGEILEVIGTKKKEDSPE